METTETKTEFARRLNLSKQYVGDLVKKGLPVTADGRVRVDPALKWLRENIRSGPGRPLGSSEGSKGESREDLEAAKIRLTIAQAEKAEIEAARLRGELISEHAAAVASRAVIRNLRDGILRIPSRYGPELAADLGVDGSLLAGKLEEMLRHALTAIADGPRPPHWEMAALAKKPAPWECGGMDFNDQEDLKQ